MLITKFYFTDSYIFAVQSDNINADLLALSDVMDFSTYDSTHPLFNDNHKSELGRYVDYHIFKKY